MIKTILLCSCLMSIGFINSCSIAPFETPKTARSLNKHQSEIDLGLSPAPYISFDYGLKEKWDLGVYAELQLGVNLGVRSRYTLLNNPEGIAVGFLGGAGLGISIVNSYHLFAAPIISFKKSWFEIYGLSRFNYVQFQDLDFDVADLAFIEKINSLNIKYFQHEVGVNFWFKPNIGLNIKGIVFDNLFSEAGLEFARTVIPSASLLYIRN